MSRFFVTLVIWLMALAIPAQGMAAATLMHCGPGHHGAPSAPHKAPVLPEAFLAAGEHAVHGHAHHTAADADVASDSAQNAADSSPTQHRCSACASCCAGVALTSKAVTLPTIDPAGEVAVLTLTRATSVVIDGPERPPRSFHV